MRKHLHELAFLALTALAFTAGGCWAEDARQAAQDALAPIRDPAPTEIRGPSPEQLIRAMGGSIDQSIDY